jgi:predicted component of type VI protein secretion system
MSSEADECEIIVSDLSVSRRHARVFFSSDELALEDLRSMNGTLLNGSELDGRRRLKLGDRIVVGSLPIEVIECESGKAPRVTRASERDGSVPELTCESSARNAAHSDRRAGPPWWTTSRRADRISNTRARRNHRKCRTAAL